MENALILIVDDDPASRETLADLLSIEPYNIELTSDGKTLFASLEQKLPDVILLDVMMPRVNGFDLCKQLKAKGKWQHIPVVLVTALNDRQSLLNGLEAGADEFLTKPVSGPELRARVRNMVRLKRQYDALQTTIQLQDDLVRMAVHDMRTPLTTIFLQTSTLLFKSRTESDKWSLDVINVEARRLDSFIDDLLILIKKDKDNLRLSLSNVKLGNMVREAIQESELLADAANVKFELILPSEDKNVSLDANLIRRVLDNLLSNAIKQSPMGGSVEVSVSFPTTAEVGGPALAPVPGPQGVRLMVSDCGKGIPPEHREKIFDMVEIVNLKQHGVSNTGIGLAFCKMVIDQHLGTIFVSENQPKGSVFVVDL